MGLGPAATDSCGRDSLQQASISPPRTLQAASSCAKVLFVPLDFLLYL